ncbi:MAG: glutamate racemase, partial [Bacillota bacterium]|nr:glutamate racemase [Bacillota bacterium]
MDNRPIGFFDSGLGGLSCLPSLLKKMPNEKVVYYGDTARTPYGSKSTATIEKISFQIS